MIDKLAADYPISLLCDLLDASRSSYYYEHLESDDDEVRQAIEKIAAEFPTYGSRRISAQLGREPYKLTVNRKRVQRLMKEMKIQCRVKKRTIHTTDSRHSFPRYPNLVRDLKITVPNQVWVADIRYIRLREEFIYLAIVMDVYTRAIRGWRLGAGLGVDLAIGALTMARGPGTPGDSPLRSRSSVRRHRLHQAPVHIGNPGQHGRSRRIRAERIRRARHSYDQRGGGLSQ